LKFLSSDSSDSPVEEIAKNKLDAGLFDRVVNFF
jgi:hypothetical protein